MVIVLLVFLARTYATVSFLWPNTIFIALTGPEGIIVVVVFISSLSIPRRPDVFRNGILVDRQFTTSLLDWISFSWVENVLQETEQSSLQIDDLPELDHRSQAETVYNIWKTNLRPRKDGSSRGLWRTMISSNSL